MKIIDCQTKSSMQDIQLEGWDESIGLELTTYTTMGGMWVAQIRFKGSDDTLSLASSDRGTAILQLSQLLKATGFALAKTAFVEEGAINLYRGSDGD